jgi:uncharacterized protein (TIGR03437 family)
MKSLRLFCALFVLWTMSLVAVAQAQHVSVSAADYSGSLAPGAIAAAFGAELASGTAAAANVPLPTTLLGTRVLVNGRAAQLFFVSAKQINYQIPEGTQTGSVEVAIERNGAITSRETVVIRDAAFSIFSLNQAGSGAGAIIDGRTFRGGPFSVRTDKGEQTILALFGTGLGDAGSAAFVSNRVQVFVGGVQARVHYAGPHPFFVGLSQINFELPPIIADQGTLPVTVRIDNTPCNTVTIDVPGQGAASVSVAFSSSAVGEFQGSFSIFSPFQDIDSLKVTIKLFTFINDQGVEVSLLSIPVTVDLLSLESLSQLIKVVQLKPGTYVSLAGEISDVAASYKGQPVAIRLANNRFAQKLSQPLVVQSETKVAISLAFDLRASVKKQDDGSYVFDPVLLSRLVLPTFPFPPIQFFSGTIVGIDQGTKQLKVQRSNGGDDSVVVDAAQATILNSNGTPADFSALANEQKIAVTGSLNDKGVIVARLIIIGGLVIIPPPIVKPVTVIGTISSIDRTAKTFVMSIESFFGTFTGNLTDLWRNGGKITVKWDDKTRFRDERSGPITDNELAVGQRVQMMTSDNITAQPVTAAEVVVLHPRVVGTIADVSKLPASFVVNAFLDPRILSPFAPVRLITVTLKPTTKIKGPQGEELKPEDLAPGNQVDVLAESLNGSEAVAEVVMVIGAFFKGSIAPADVKAGDNIFILTQFGTGLRVTVKISDQTLLALRDKTGKTLLKPDEFFKHLLNQPWSADVSGRLEAPGILRAATVVIE